MLGQPSKGHRAISKILFLLDFYTLAEQNTFFSWEVLFLAILHTYSHMVFYQTLLEMHGFQPKVILLTWD